MIGVARSDVAAETVLDSFPAVASRDLDDARQTVGDLFVPHGLDLLDRAERFHFSLRSAHLESVGLELLDYGASVQISPQSIDDIVLVQLPLAGTAETCVGGHSEYTMPGSASILPLGRPILMKWSANAPHLIVYMTYKALDDVAQAMYGDLRASMKDLPLTLKLTTSYGATFADAVRSLHHDLNQAGPIAVPPFAQRLIQETVMMRLLMAAADQLAQTERSSATPTFHEGRLVRRFLTLAQETIEDPLTPIEMAQKLQVPLRSLQHAVRRELDTTVTQTLLRARLERTRAILLSTEATTRTVSEVAAQAGFTHLGRFAAYYRDAFGERPSSTLRR